MRVVDFVFGPRWLQGPLHANLVMAHCHNLTHVKLSCVAVCMPELRALLRTNPHIERVTISNSADYANSLDSSFDDIMLPKLSALVVTNYHLGDKKILGAIKKGNIVRLDLSSCFFAGSVLLEIAALCPQLRAAVLSDLSFQGLTDELLKKFTTLCPHIAHLDISKADDVTDAGMLSVVQNLKGLHSLKISDDSKLTETSLKHIYTHCADTLHTFMFSYYSSYHERFSIVAVNNLLERCTKLRTVYLNDKSKGKYGEPFIFSAAAVCNLTTLAIGGDIMCDENVDIIRTHAKHLEVLEIDSEYLHNSLFDLVNTCLSLRKFHYDVSFQCDATSSIPDVLTAAYC